MAPFGGTPRRVVFSVPGRGCALLPASEKSGFGLPLSVVSLRFGCQNPVDARQVLRDLRVTLRKSSSTITCVWGDESVGTAQARCAQVEHQRHSGRCPCAGRKGRGSTRARCRRGRAATSRRGLVRIDTGCVRHARSRKTLRETAGEKARVNGGYSCGGASPGNTGAGWRRRNSSDRGDAQSRSRAKAGRGQKARIHRRYSRGGPRFGWQGTGANDSRRRSRKAGAQKEARGATEDRGGRNRRRWPEAVGAGNARGRSSRRCERSNCRRTDRTSQTGGGATDAAAAGSCFSAAVTAP